MSAHLGELIDLGGSVAAVAAANETGLLDSLSSPASPEEHARRLDLHPAATVLVLETLVALGVADREDGCVRASTPVAANGNPLHGLMPMQGLWRHLPRFLKTGEPYVEMDGQPAQRAAGYRELVPALGGLFEQAANELAAKLPPAGERILDIGAGSGVWSLAMCASSRGSTVTALDLPDVLPAFRGRAERLGLAARVRAQPGDFHAVRLGPETYDRIVLANVLHLERAEDARSLVCRATAALEPGGELVVVDCFTDDDPARQTAYAVYALHLAMRTRGGHPHPRADLERWAREAGLTAGELVRLDARPWSVSALVHRLPLVKPTT